MQINIEQQIPFIAGGIALLGVLLSLAAQFRLRRQRKLLAAAVTRIDELEEIVDDRGKQLNAQQQKLAEHSRRVAWLEARKPAEKKQKNDILDENTLTEAPKLNITERRHRVMALASRGQSAESIASALGMLTGEVELIVSLNQAANRR